MTKIPLFYKPSIIKASFALLVALVIVGTPNNAHANVISDFIARVVGVRTTQAAQALSPADPVIHNSQTVPLLESSINPDMKNMRDDSQTVAIVDDQALATDNAPTGTDAIDKQYATSEIITTYTVKEGDTLDKISKKFNTSKAAIIQSNDFLDAKGMLTAGQVLAILPVVADKTPDKSTTQAKTTPLPVKTVDKQIAQAAPTPLKDTPQVQKPVAVVTPPVVVPAPQVKVQTPAVVSEVQVAAEAPSAEGDGGDTSDTAYAATGNEGQSGATNPVASSGFIWPVPLGVGRISQGLHDDNAMDLAAPKGTPIYAPKSGTILIAHDTGWNGGYGLYVVMNFDDGGQMLFGHMSKVASAPGDIKKQGEIIGYVGTTGSSTGNHVHLSARGIKNPYAILRVGETSAEFK